MPKLPPLVYGANDRHPPNMLTLIVWQQVLGVRSPITLHFPVTPESMSILDQYLTTVTPTHDGGWVDDFGPAPSPIDISGTFGYNTKGHINGGLYTGFGWVKYLQWMVKISHEGLDDGSIPEVWLLSHLSQDFYEVELMSFSKTQTVTRNMLWSYNVKATILRPITGSPLLDAALSALVSEITTKASEAVSNVGRVSL